jgi:hypothetical protein
VAAAGVVSGDGVAAEEDVLGAGVAAGVGFGAGVCPKPTPGARHATKAAAHKAAAVDDRGVRSFMAPSPFPVCRPGGLAIPYRA